MKIKLIIIAYSFVNIIATQSYCQKPKESKIDQYKMFLNYIDTNIIDVSITFNVSNNNKKENYLLLNSCISIKELKTNDKYFTYNHKNDTLFYNTNQNSITFSIKYLFNLNQICIIDSLKNPNRFYNTNPILFNNNQLFFERYHRWYPLLYDNFAKFKVTVQTPIEYNTYSYPSAKSIKNIGKNKITVFDTYDEDMPIIISKMNIFNYYSINNNGIIFNYYYLKNQRRLLILENGKPQFTTDSLQVDSLQKTINNKCVLVFNWFNKNLWEKDIKNLNFIEGYDGLGGFGLGNFIFLTSSLINHDLYYNHLISHEIGHIWLGVHTEYNAKGRNFLAESINEYVNMLCLEDLFGHEKYNYILNELKIKPTSTYKVKFDDVLNARKWVANRLYNEELIYFKGPIFLHKFRELIGKEKLLKIIREAYSVENKFLNLQDLEQSIKANGCWHEYLKLYEMSL